MMFGGKLSVVFITICLVQILVIMSFGVLQYDNDNLHIAQQRVFTAKETGVITKTPENASYQTMGKPTPEVTQLFVKENEMMRRVEHLRNACKKNNTTGMARVYTGDHYLKHVIMDRTSKVLYCYVPKVANTNFRRIFVAHAEHISMENAFNLSGYEIYSKYLNSLVPIGNVSGLEREAMLQTSRKFLFVREPLERLLSAYNNKFFHPNERMAYKYYERINEFYERHPALGKMRNITVDVKARNITFNDFLTYWTDVHESGERVNEHFVIASELCSPCKVQFDFIGKFDSLYSDVEFIFDRLGIDVQFPGRNDNYTSARTAALVKQSYKHVPKQLMSKVIKTLEPDFTLFGYTVPSWSL